jgi:Uma2 family endonuclease
MTTTVSGPATEADLMAMPSDGHKYELVHGEIRRLSPAGARHGEISAEICARLREFVKPRGLGRLFDSSTGFRLPNGNVRSPDVSFVAKGRFENDESPVGYSPVVPDLAVEVRSPNDTAQEVLDKVGDYLDAGVRLVWVIDPQERRANRYRSLTDVRTASVDDELDGEDVLPGFSCRLGEIFL